LISAKTPELHLSFGRIFYSTKRERHVIEKWLTPIKLNGIWQILKLNM
jgi:hypothetical protein